MPLDEGDYNNARLLLFGNPKGSDEALRIYRQFTFRVVPEDRSGSQYLVYQMSKNTERNKFLSEDSSLLEMKYMGTLREHLWNDNAFLINVKKKAKFFMPMNFIPPDHYLVQFPEDRNLLTVSGARALGTALLGSTGKFWPYSVGANLFGKCETGIAFENEADALLVQCFVIADEDEE